MSYGQPPPGGPGYPYQPPPQQPYGHQQYGQQPYGQQYPQQWGPQQGPYPGGGWGGGAACPRCQSPNIRKPSYTWWGGFIGPAIINHWVCNQCRFGFNPRTGQSTQGAITVYILVTMGIALVIGLGACASAMR
jgi:hypothetical protein